jgi:AcrR family transcriptional regulator
MDAPDPAARGRAARRYRSPRREQQARRTRARITAAAAQRFLACGYAATTMRAVAADARVALPTVELAFGTKAQLLKAAIDVAIAGDDEPVPMLTRGWAEQAESMAGPAEFAAVFAEVLAQSAQRAAGLTLAALEAARSDEDITAVAAQLMTQRQVMATWLVDGLLRRSPLRNGTDRAAAIDTIWTLMDPAVFCRLTGDRGWSATRFRDWFTDSTLRLLLPIRDRQATAANHPRISRDQHPPRSYGRSPGQT